MTPADDRYGLGPGGPDPFDDTMTRSLNRIAGRAPHDAPGLAGAAMREATSIRRRRTGMSVAAVAAAFAIAVPLTWQIARGQDSNTVVPAVQSSTTAVSESPSAVSTSPATGGASPTSVPTETSPAVPTGSTATTEPDVTPGSGQAVIGNAAASTPIVPYLVGGTYHGASGTGPLAAKIGIQDALLLEKQRIVVFVNTGGSAETIVQERSGTVLARLSGSLGEAHANATGDRFAAVDNDTRKLGVYDSSGTQVHSYDLAADLRVAGWAGTKVFLTGIDSGGTKVVDTDVVNGSVGDWSDDYMFNANDTHDRALMRTRNNGDDVCWSLISVADHSEIAKDCGAEPIYRLGYDGEAVIGLNRDADDGVVATLTRPGHGTTFIGTPKGQHVLQAEYSLATKTVVLSIVGDDGANGLVACTLDGACRPLASPIANPGWAEAPAPYVLVRG